MDRRIYGFVAAAALFLAGLAAPAHATFQPSQTSDYPDEKRHLCYRLDKAVADDPLWVAWIDNAIAAWSAADTGWTFRKCTDEDKIPDIRFSFDKSDAGAQGNFRATGTEYYQIIIQQNVVGLTNNGVTITEGGNKGWRLENGPGQVMLDPELVMEHEIGHALRLSHIPGQCNTGDLEEPICPGNHNNPVGRKPSAKDIAEAKKSFNDRTAAHAAADNGPKKNETTPIEYVVGGGFLVGWQTLDNSLTISGDPIPFRSRQNQTLFQPFGEIGFGIPVQAMGINAPKDMDLYFGVRLGGTVNGSKTSPDQFDAFDFHTSQGFFINPNVQLWVPVGGVDVYGEAGAMLRHIDLDVGLGSTNIVKVSGFLASPEIGLGVSIPLGSGFSLVPGVMVDFGGSLDGRGSGVFNQFIGKVESRTNVSLSAAFQKKF